LVSTRKRRCASGWLNGSAVGGTCSGVAGVPPVARFNSASAASCGSRTAISNSVSSFAPPDLAEPLGRHAVAEQRIVGDAREQQRLRCGYRRDYGWYGDVLDPLGEFDELGGTCRRVPFDPASLGPRIGHVVVTNIA
jgi:hypothetical protein